MREGYRRSKLFFLVLMVVTGILLIPDGGMLPAGRSPEAQSRTEVAKPTVISPMAGITVKNDSTGAVIAGGNGVLLESSDEELWLVTARHVLEHAADGNIVYVTMGDGEHRTDIVCDRYEAAEDADLAFLCLDKTRTESALKSISEQTAAVQFDRAQPPDKEAYDGLQAGDPVQVTGWQAGKLVTYDGVLLDSWIYVEDFEQYMIAAQCEIHAGMSGCGIYDRQGRLLGIVCGGDETGRLVAVPLHMLQARWEDLR